MTLVKTITSITPHKRKSFGVQSLRFYAQLFSLLLNIVIGIQFYLWVRHLESPDTTLSVSRPEGVEGWLPIGALVSARHFFETGVINDIHPSGLFIFVTIVVTSFIFRRAFCSWICPVGFISEMLGDISDRVFGKRLKLPSWLDWPLRSLKYLLLLFFIWAIFFQMTPAAIKSFVYSDYNVVSDLLMLKFFTDISMFSLGVISFLFLMSLIIRGFWCRYLCPYGALVGIAGFFSPTRITRSSASCIDCAVCTRVCPSFIKIKTVKQVWSDECTGCMACVDSCPVSNTIQIGGYKKFRLTSKQWAISMLVFFWGTLFVIKLVGPWENGVSDDRYRQMLPGVEQGAFAHPGADGK